MPDVVLETRFGVPPDFEARWLTDFREDDLERYDNVPENRRVTRGRGGVVLETEVHGEAARSRVTIETPRHWRLEGSMGDPASPTARLLVVETVGPDAEGTLHRLEATLTPVSASAKMLTLSW